MTTLPARTRIVVIGGGVVGCSVAYHLAGLGCRDVVVLERSKLGSGTSWHAAGNMETYRPDPVLGELIRYGVGLYPTLERESGQQIGWRQTGRVMFAADPARMAQYRTLPALGRARGIEIEVLSPAEVADRLPVVSPVGLLGGAWVPGDGRVNPTDLATAYARGAKAKGVAVIEDVAVTRILTTKGRVSGVLTAQGVIACEEVVVAAGLWSRELGADAGAAIPLHAVQHFYAITKPIAGLPRDLPMFLSYDERIYGREEVGGLLVGVFDSNALPVSPAQLPRDFSFGLLEENWEQVGPNLDIALHRFPVLREAEIRLLLNGPESFTPDMQMLLGETPEVQRLFVAAGMNSSGIALAAGAGRLTAEWIIEGRSSIDVTRLDIRRFAPEQSHPAYLRQRVAEVPTHMCLMPAPGLDFASARMLRRSPVHAQLLAAGAHFTSIMQWEVPAWFRRPGEEDGDALVAAEIAASDTAGVLIDRSSDVTLWLEGRDAGRLLRRLSGAPDLAVGDVRLAPMLNERGGVEALPLLWRRREDAWQITASADQATRLTYWIQRHRGDDSVALVDVTAGWAAFILAGPGASAVAASVQESSGAPVNILPGELPFQQRLTMPACYAAAAFEAVQDAGHKHGLRCAGSLAEEALLARSGLPRFGTNASPFCSAASIGVDRFLDLTGNTGFIGRDALARELAG